MHELFGIGVCPAYEVRLCWLMNLQSVVQHIISRCRLANYKQMQVGKCAWQGDRAMRLMNRRDKYLKSCCIIAAFLFV